MATTAPVPSSGTPEAIHRSTCLPASGKPVSSVTSDEHNLHNILRNKEYGRVEPICLSLQRHDTALVDDLVREHYLHYNTLLQEVFNVLSHPSGHSHRLTASLLLVLPFVNSTLNQRVASRYVVYDTHDLFCPALVAALCERKKEMRVSIVMKSWILCAVCHVLEAQVSNGSMAKTGDCYELIPACLQILQCPDSMTTGRNIKCYYSVKRYALRILKCQMVGAGVASRKYLQSLSCAPIVCEVLESLARMPAAVSESERKQSVAVFNDRQWLVINCLEFMYCAFHFSEMWRWKWRVALPPYLRSALQLAAERYKARTRRSAQNDEELAKAMTAMDSEISVAMSPLELVFKLKALCSHLVEHSTVTQVRIAALILFKYPLAAVSNECKAKKKQPMADVMDDSRWRTRLPQWNHAFQQLLKATTAEPKTKAKAKVVVAKGKSETTTTDCLRMDSVILSLLKSRRKMTNAALIEALRPIGTVALIDARVKQLLRLGKISRDQSDENFLICD